VTPASRDRLYNLLPAMYRERDAAEGYPLRGLLQIIGEQVDIVEGNIRRLYDDLFIETCQDWVIPYIGNLVGNDLLFDAGRTNGDITARKLFPDLAGKDLRPPVAVRVRADVAKTIYYRRRKGTPPMLEELARDVTGWPAHVVEFFELLGWTQHREHRRFQSRWTDVRSFDRMERIGGPFDETSHTVDVRQVSQREGWHNIHNLGFFVWRLQGYPLDRVPARQAGEPWRYHFSPLGHPAPLFSRWRREGDEAGMATELHVPAPIRRAFFAADLDRYRASEPVRPDFTDLYGLFTPIEGDPTTPCPECSFFIVRNGTPVLPAQDPAAPESAFQPQIICQPLDPWPAAPPSGRVIAVDVQTGRIAVGDGWGDPTTSLDVSYLYGFSADLGGGPYERGKWLIRSDLAGLQLRVKEDGTVPPGAPPVTHTSLVDALNDWAAAGRPNAIITVLDSRTYALPATIELRNEGWLAIEAANGQRPLLQAAAAGLDVDVLTPAVPGDPDRRSALTLGGVIVEGFIHVTGDLGHLRLLHSTLVPGSGLDEAGDPMTAGPSLEVEGGAAGAEINTQLRVELAFSIAGPLTVPAHAAGLWLLDCIVDGLAGAAVSGPGGGGSGPPLTVERSTLFGSLGVKSLHLSESIVTGQIDAERTQEGCARFSYVVPGSQTPRKYRCQPDLAVAAAIEEASQRNPALTQAERNAIRVHVESWLVPAFTTRRYGQPGYAQLQFRCPREIRTGAEDGAEMGAFCHLEQPQRESNLRLRLREYLPFGLEAGVIYVT
jgi:hypothetical protein